MKPEPAFPSATRICRDLSGRRRRLASLELRKIEYRSSTGCLLADAPRLARPLPVKAWASACGLDREPGADPRTIALIGPGPGFDPAYALGTDLAQPVIIATLAPAGQPPAPLLIDGMHRLYKAHALGVAELPSWVLTAAETEAIRCPSRPRPARTRAVPGDTP